MNEKQNRRRVVRMANLPEQDGPIYTAMNYAVSLYKNRPRGTGGLLNKFYESRIRFESDAVVSDKTFTTALSFQKIRRNKENKPNLRAELIFIQALCELVRQSLNDEGVAYFQKSIAELKSTENKALRDQGLSQAVLKKLNMFNVPKKCQEKRESFLKFLRIAWDRVIAWKNESLDPLDAPLLPPKLNEGAPRPSWVSPTTTDDINSPIAEPVPKRLKLSEGGSIACQEHSVMTAESVHSLSSGDDTESEASEIPFDDAEGFVDKVGKRVQVMEEAGTLTASSVQNELKQLLSSEFFVRRRGSNTEQ